jgi:hypothetical protein
MQVKWGMDFRAVNIFGQKSLWADTLRLLYFFLGKSVSKTHDNPAHYKVGLLDSSCGL